MDTPVLRYFLTTRDAKRPSYGSAGAVGLDLRSARDNVVPARGQALIDTDLKIILPPGTYGRIAPRSGLAWNFSITVGGGVIDPDYRGLVAVILYNLSDQAFFVHKGERIAQLICEKVERPNIVEEEEEDIDFKTVRGTAGFGSTGMQ